MHRHLEAALLVTGMLASAVYYICMIAISFYGPDQSDDFASHAMRVATIAFGPVIAAIWWHLIRLADDE